MFLHAQHDGSSVNMGVGGSLAVPRNRLPAGQVNYLY